MSAEAYKRRLRSQNVYGGYFVRTHMIIIQPINDSSLYFSDH